MALSAQELAAALGAHGRGLSQRTLGDYARTSSNETGGRGRQDGLASIPVRPLRIYASALLDRNTCPACYGLDGKEYGSVEESLVDFPSGGYIGCDGGLRCRCSRVFVWPSEGTTGPDRERPTDPNPRPAGPAPGAPPPSAPAGVPRIPSDVIELETNTIRSLPVLTARGAEEGVKALDAVVRFPDRFENGIRGGGRLPLQRTSRPNLQGGFLYDEDLNEAVRMVLNPNTVKAPGLTVAHEAGHFLDYVGLPGPGFTTEDLANFGPGGVLERFAKAAAGSPSWQRLAMARGGVLPDGSAILLGADDKALLDYYLGADETWARAFAQYVAMKSGNPRLLRELDDLRRREAGVGTQWTDEEFGPIMEAIDAILEELGLAP